MAHVCDSHLTTGYEFNENTASKDIFEKLEDVRIYFHDHKRVVIQALSSLIIQVAPTMSDVLFFCKKRNNPTNCDSYFSEVWTEDGKCFTYNIVNSTTLYTSE